MAQPTTLLQASIFIDTFDGKLEPLNEHYDLLTIGQLKIFIKRTEILPLAAALTNFMKEPI